LGRFLAFEGTDREFEIVDQRAFNFAPNVLRAFGIGENCPQRLSALTVCTIAACRHEAVFSSFGNRHTSKNRSSIFVATGSRLTAAFRFCGNPPFYPNFVFPETAKEKTSLTG